MIQSFAQQLEIHTLGGYDSFIMPAAEDRWGYNLVTIHPIHSYNGLMAACLQWLHHIDYRIEN